MPATIKVAPQAMYRGFRSEMGLPVAMLPPTEAVFLMGGPAK